MIDCGLRNFKGAEIIQNRIQPFFWAQLIASSHLVKVALIIKSAGLLLGQGRGAKTSQ